MPDHQTSPVGEDAERAAFEAWAKRVGLSLDVSAIDGMFIDHCTISAYDAWHAGRAAPTLDASGLPPLPAPAHRGPDGTGSYFDSWTADQVRQAQREALYQGRVYQHKVDQKIIDRLRETVADLRAQVASERQAKEYEQRHAVESEAALAQVQAALAAARQVGKHLFDAVADGAAPTQPKAQVGEGQ